MPARYFVVASIYLIDLYKKWQHSTQRIQHRHSSCICGLFCVLKLIAFRCLALQLQRSIIPTKEKVKCLCDCQKRSSATY